MVRVKVKRHRGFAFPIPFRVINEWFEALGDLVRVGEVVLKFVPLPQEAGARKQMSWLKTLSLNKFTAFTQSLLMDLNHYKGLDIVDVETGDVQVKVSLR
jgi:hypothetical protein